MIKVWNELVFITHDDDVDEADGNMRHQIFAKF